MLNKIKKGFDKCMKKIEVLTKFIYDETNNSIGRNRIHFGVCLMGIGLTVFTLSVLYIIEGVNDLNNK